MSEINCNACNDLKNTSPNFVQNGITNTECSSLAADTGLNPSLRPKHNDAEDLHDMNDCLVGRMEGDLEKYDVCDWQDFMAKFISNLYELLKGIICAIGGIWTHIHNLLSRVASLETRMTNLEGRVTALETWKAAMDTWKNGIDAWRTTINNWKSGIDSWKDGINSWQTTINNWKSGIDTWKGTVDNTLSNHGNRISALEAQVSGHTTAINNLDNRIAEIIAAMGVGPNEMLVIRKYAYTVPVEKFERTWQVTCIEQLGTTSTLTAWFSGSPTYDEDYITIPVSEMDSVIGVWAQPKVVGGKTFTQTVAVQTYVKQGNNLIVNFDAYEIAPNSSADPSSKGPYPMPVEFLVVGKKSIT